MRRQNNELYKSQYPPESAVLRGEGKGIYDSFANYLVYCPKCKHVAKTNMYIQRAEAYIDELHERGTVCPKCGDSDWTLGYPLGTLTGFVKFS